MEGPPHPATIGSEDRASSKPSFDYNEAFSRNLGWITAAEQQVLRRKRVAIAGLGGVGGFHLLTLTRLGIGAFNIADFDRFELANFNRQAGAMVSTLGQPKAQTLARMARDVNPTLDLRVFPHGVDDANLDSFLENVDLYVDSLDFFVLELRRKLFRRLEELRVPSIIAAPIGMGSGYLVFKPGGMTFEEWFRLDGLPSERQRIHFMVGLTPRGFQRRYLVDPSRVDLKGERGPSTGLSCELCAGVAAAEALKLLLNRGPVRAVPRYHQFDGYTAKLARGWLPGGNANPLQRLKIAVASRLSERWTRNAVPKTETPADDMGFILDQARWAPSGDNVQPWRFEVLGDDRVIVRLKRDPENIYDFNDGEPTVLAGGFLLETMRIAASGRGRGMTWTRLGRDGDVERIQVDFPRSASAGEDPLLPFIPIRSVNRGPYRLAPLSAGQKLALEEAVGDQLTIEWQEDFALRWKAALRNAAATDIRLRIPETFDVHRKIIDWDRNFSPTGIPAAAVGLDPLTRRVMKWLMRDWRRFDRFNRLPGGTLLARVEMDLVPGLLSAAHFTMRRKSSGADGDVVDGLLRAGASVQRFWLTATSLGLALQPSFAPLCFGRRGGATSSDDARSERLWSYSEANEPDVVFLGRIGTPRTARISARSVRLPVDQISAKG
jgi:sulfur-carrier protein adenylyltransferase/sulfurtransferase